MSPVAPVRIESVHGQQLVSPRTWTVLGSSGTDVYHEAAEPILITYSRPPTIRVWEQPSTPMLSQERG